ncbi:MAG: transketolase [Chloroflexi bacterium]|nr:transketolase [Chloroflexota bacterium]MCL5110905.1 transketolase [Chloroflexota bacterium]
MSESREELLARLLDRATAVRAGVMVALNAAGSGHVGGSMSIADVLTVLYFHTMRYDPKNPRWPDRDRLVLSKGHANAALTPVLAEAGFYDKELVKTFNKLNSPFGMHPDMRKIPGCDMSTGALGHGLAVGVGMALGARLQNKGFRTYVIMGDGELNEGSIWESAMAAARFGLDNLVGIVDRNRFCLGSATEDTMPIEPLADKWRAFGWAVREIDGNDLAQVVDTFDAAPFVEGKPTLILAHTVKGKGFSRAEDRCDWHYQTVNEEVLEAALAELQAPGQRS